jgi:hypothetical protein
VLDARIPLKIGIQAHFGSILKARDRAHLHSSALTLRLKHIRAQAHTSLGSCTHVLKRMSLGLEHTRLPECGRSPLTT